MPPADHSNSLDFVVQYKVFMEDSINTMASLISSRNTSALGVELYKDLLSMNDSDIKVFIESKRRELVKNCVIRLCAKLEWMVQTDYKKNKRKYKKKINFQKELRNCEPQRIGESQQKIYTLDSLVKCWKAEMTLAQTDRHIGPLKRFLRYRHWLAHGEHWSEPEKCEIDEIFDKAYMAAKNFLASINIM